MTNGLAAAERTEGEREAAIGSCLAKRPRGPSRAAIECGAYAERAVRANAFNERYECGFTNRRRWRADQDWHYRTCLTMTPAERAENERIRRRAVQRCAVKRGATPPAL